jgi:hypothetical protein
MDRRRWAGEQAGGTMQSSERIPAARSPGWRRTGTNDMNPLGAYLMTKSREAGKSPESGYPDNDPLGGTPEPRPGLRARVRKLLPLRRRTASEPGFAATHSMLSEFVPQVRAYPYPPTPPTYR